MSINLPADRISKPKLLSGGATLPIAGCKLAPEGAKVQQFQLALLNGSANNCYQIYLNANTTVIGFSQFAAIYIDNKTDGTVSVIFPDTQYQIDLGARESGLYPVFTSNVNAPFYVVMAVTGLDSSQFVNIYCLNQFIPEFKNTVLPDPQNVEITNWPFHTAASVPLSLPDSAITNDYTSGIQLNLNIVATAAKVCTVTMFGTNFEYQKLFNLVIGNNIISIDLFFPIRIFTDGRPIDIDLDNFTNISSATGYINIQSGS